MHQYHFSTADTDSKYKTSLSNLFVFDKIEEDESFFKCMKKKAKTWFDFEGNNQYDD